MGAEGKLVANQLGHSLDVNQNVYTQSQVESRLVIVIQPDKRLLIQYCWFSVKDEDWHWMSLKENGMRE